AISGRTVLFVSHNMSAVMQLTKRAIVLSAGEVDYIGPPSAAVEKYIQGARANTATEFDVRSAKRRHQGTGEVKILSFRYNRRLAHFKFLEPLQYVVRIRGEKAVEILRVAMTVFAVDGSPIGNSFSPEIEGLEAGEERDLLITLASARFAPGAYYCGVSIGRGNHRTS